MSIMKSLEYTAADRKFDPVVVRRDKLIERLNYQLELVKDVHFTPTEKRWIKNKETGEKSLVERQKRIKPWWFKTQSGEFALTVRAGLKKIEFEKGKTAIRAGSKENLTAVLNNLVAATEAGELDKFIGPAPSKKMRI